MRKALKKFWTLPNCPECQQQLKLKDACNNCYWVEDKEEFTKKWKERSLEIDDIVAAGAALFGIFPLAIFISLFDSTMTPFWILLSGFIVLTSFVFFKYRAMKKEISLRLAIVFRVDPD